MVIVTVHGTYATTGSRTQPEQSDRHGGGGGIHPGGTRGCEHGHREEDDKLNDNKNKKQGQGSGGLSGADGGTRSFVCGTRRRLQVGG